MEKPTHYWPERTVLIAEDEPINFMLLRKILEITACKVIWAKNGQEAVDAVGKEPIDLILMDIRMPVLDGIKATRIITENKPGLPIIAVTAFNLSNEAEQCQEAGCCGFLNKPVMPKELLELIEKQFRQL